MSKKLEEIFENYFIKNYWNGKESISGPGSSGESTERIRQLLPIIFSGLKISSVADAPCGDFHWWNKMKDDLDIINYHGFDISKSVIKSNKKYEGTNTKHNISFSYADITIDLLPQVDLIFCRDCLVHLTSDNILKVLKLFVRSESKYLLTTTNFLTRTNKNIEDGQWRPINLQKKPFNLPNPLLIIHEDGTRHDNTSKSLGLWDLRKIHIV